MKVIIDNCSDLPTNLVLLWVADMIKEPSCYLQKAKYKGKNYHMVMCKNKKSDKFTVYKQT